MATSRVTETLRDIGHAAFLWNRIHEGWFLIFTCLLKDVSRPVVEAIFKQFDSDRARRELVSAVAAAALDPRNKHRKRIGQLIAKTNDESGNRNSIMHAQFHLSESGTSDADIIDLAIGSDTSTKRVNRFEFKELKSELPAFVSRLQALDREVEELRIDMAGLPFPHQKWSLADLLADILQQEEKGNRLLRIGLAVEPDSEQPTSPLQE